jgi:hypothetical protein
MQMLGSRASGAGDSAPREFDAPAQSSGARPAATKKPASAFSEMDDDIPF